MFEAKIGVGQRLRRMVGISDRYVVNRGWRLLLEDLRISPGNVLRRARLPEDLFARFNASLSQDEYFRLWDAVIEETNDPLLPLRIGSVVSTEAFDPPIFAAMCSPNLTIAVQRIAVYKRLIAPVEISVDIDDEHMTVGLRWYDLTSGPPASYVLTQHVFFTELARIATRRHVRPVALTMPKPPPRSAAVFDYFGTHVERSPRTTLVFSREDAERPFLTANELMWSYFEPELRRRLFELDASATTAERVRAALLELLPNGSASVADVAAKLGVSKRTLQRRLEQESQRYQTILDETREALARHYLRTSTMTGSEIAFLLGFDDPNSFFRAFRAWTGETPEGARSAMTQN